MEFDTVEETAQQEVSSPVPTIQVHQHNYQIVARDCVIVRWCTQCGFADMLEKNVVGNPFPSKWKRINESYHI